ncbi:14827_t:CDS:1, partial [Funneliformis mosseae]
IDENNSSTEIDSIDSEDFHEASLEEDINNTIIDNKSQYPNDIY